MNQSAEVVKIDELPGRNRTIKKLPLSLRKRQMARRIGALITYEVMCRSKHMTLETLQWMEGNPGEVLALAEVSFQKRQKALAELE